MPTPFDGKTTKHEALVLDVRRDVYTLTVTRKYDVVNVTYTPRDDFERALLDRALHESFAIEVEIAANTLVVAVDFLRRR